MSDSAALQSARALRSDADVNASLLQIEQCLGSDPVRADALAAELLAFVPDHSMALLFQGIAKRLKGDPAGAREILAPLCRRWPNAPLPHLQLGLALQRMGEYQQAIQSMRRAVKAKPDFSDGWLALAELLTAAKDAPAADQAYGMYIKSCAQDVRLAESRKALRENRIDDAQARLSEQLNIHPQDVVAICMLAEAAGRRSQYDIAEMLLKQCLDLAPSYRAARHNYAVVLMRQNKIPEALCEIEHLLAQEPGSTAVQSLKAAVLMQQTDYESAARIYQAQLAERPGQPKVWISLGHARRALGQRQRCIDAYRQAIALSPQSGEAYWSLANLKTLQIAADELGAMRRQLARRDLSGEERIYLCFAVGKALEDRNCFAEAFEHYAEGNRLQHSRSNYQPDGLTDYVRRAKAFFTEEFFAERAGQGAPCADPIFIVGLPRVGSTLVEQILASHSAVEGTMELPHMASIVKSLIDRKADGDESQYPGLLSSLTANELYELGQRYIERTRAQRRVGKQFFIDKMPNNFAHVGLIKLMLPNARIVDVRRHPLACGLSLFKQLFSHAQQFSYSLEDIGRYYRDYVELMAHFDSILPGRVHRVSYELLVEDTEAQVRSLLGSCGLPFEAACLEFHRNQRSIATPSSEQVRKPIFRQALDGWRNYERWLLPLREQLGELCCTHPLTTDHAAKNESLRRGRENSGIKSHNQG